MLILLFIRIVLAILAFLLVAAATCHILPRLGARGRRLADQLTRAPGLDLLVTYFTALPLIAGPIAGTLYLGDGIFAALAGLIAAILAQILAVLVWARIHEMLHPSETRGPRIVNTLNAKVGPLRNHAAVWITALCVPIFWVIRLAQYVVYPPLTRLVRFPRYNDPDWINVSRHKFQGLVGHDLIWCLYCDWMTGVWSLGSEMLRNVESFWCPIRFRSDRKCENCRIDFPDVATTWVAADATMSDVTALLDDKLAHGNHAWHAHPTRLTVGDTDPTPGTEHA